MKKRFLKTILPVLLLVTAVFIIGSGCGDGGVSNWWYEDADGDGFGIYESRLQDEDQPQGYVSNTDDCDDTDAAINPDATEVPDNEIDENCNDLFGITFYKDDDADGFGNPNNSGVFEVNFGDPAPGGTSYNNADCDDTDPMINPKADEIVGNDIDDNCDGDIDILEYYTDADGDGYGAGNALPPPATGVNNNLDCDDTNPEIHPYAMERDNGIDDDCDGIIDELI